MWCSLRAVRLAATGLSLVAAGVASAAGSVGDFNGDGKADILLRHTDGRWRIYAMDGRHQIGADSGSVGLPTAPAYYLGGVGDFNGDGKDDVLLRHDNGRWFYYPLDGRTILSGGGRAFLTPNAGWTVVGTGDLNGDGNDDVLIRNVSGRWYYYPMNGRRTLPGRGDPNLTRDTAWRFAGMGDLNDDGRDDVLLRHGDGRWYYYPMDGRRVVAAARGLADLPADLASRVAGIADLDGDGKGDVLLRRSDGRWPYYRMDGRQRIPAQHELARINRDLRLSLAGLGDFNGDGKDDALLRHDDGRWYYYPMNGRLNIAPEKGWTNLPREADWRSADVRRSAIRTDQFQWVTANVSGLVRQWGYPPRSGPYTGTFPLEFASGIAAADYDADGDVDLYVVGGSDDSNRLFRNRGDGTFEDATAEAGLDVVHLGCGPAFADIDGDGDLDLFVGAVENDPYYLFENRDGRFHDITPRSGLVLDAANTVSATFFDYDMDDDLDLFLAHWGFSRQADTQTVWRNTGDGIFESASIESGIAGSLIIESENYQTGEVAYIDRSLTPIFSDIDADGDGDLLMAADYDTSQVFLNDGDGTFTRTTDRNVIVDQSGMGASVGDYDNDGDFDWFVTSIYEEPGFFGNRLYRNDGHGVFEDATEEAGVADGGWGWASCFKDFDNDGHLDIVHVNGWRGDTGDPGSDPTVFMRDEMRFYRSRGDGTFASVATRKWLRDRGQGRSLACFDADRDGAIDIVLTNSDGNHLVYYRNELATARDNHYLAIKLRSAGGNRFGVGAKIAVATKSGTQIRELRAGNNFASHDPLEVHFGLGADRVADIRVTWPDGTITVKPAVWADQILTIVK